MWVRFPLGVPKKPLPKGSGFLLQPPGIEQGGSIRRMRKKTVRRTVFADGVTSAVRRQARKRWENPTGGASKQNADNSFNYKDYRRFFILWNQHYLFYFSNIFCLKKELYGKHFWKPFKIATNEQYWEFIGRSLPGQPQESRYYDIKKSLNCFPINQFFLLLH